MKEHWEELTNELDMTKDITSINDNCAGPGFCNCRCEKLITHLCRSKPTSEEVCRAIGNTGDIRLMTECDQRLHAGIVGPIAIRPLVINCLFPVA